jgi:hypothetical protein
MIFGRSSGVPLLLIDESDEETEVASFPVARRRKLPAIRIWGHFHPLGLHHPLANMHVGSDLWYLEVCHVERNRSST